MSDFLIRVNRPLMRYEVIQDDKVLAWVTTEAMSASEGEAMRHLLSRLAQVGLIELPEPPAPRMPSPEDFAELAAKIRRRVAEAE